MGDHHRRGVALPLCRLKCHHFQRTRCVLQGGRRHGGCALILGLCCVGCGCSFQSAVVTILPTGRVERPRTAGTAMGELTTPRTGTISMRLVSFGAASLTGAAPHANQLSRRIPGAASSSLARSKQRQSMGLSISATSGSSLFSIKTRILAATSQYQPKSRLLDSLERRWAASALVLPTAQIRWV